MTVRSVTRTKRMGLVTADEHDVFLTMVERLTRHNIGVLVVLDLADRLMGIISERDLVRALARHQSAVFAHTARDIMTTKVLTCTPQEQDVHVMTRMIENHIRHMPVIEDGRVIGLVSLGELVKNNLTKLGHQAGSSQASAASTSGNFSSLLRSRPGSDRA